MNDLIVQRIKKLLFNALGYDSEPEIIEELFLTALVSSFERIKKDLKTEEKIRDAFVFDLENHNPSTKDLLKEKAFFLSFEKWINVSEEEKSRADVVFSTTGFEFVLECKRLEYADKLYLEQGIKRFIDLKYAEKDDFAGMLGFVIKGKPEHIIKNLKKKVVEFHPAESMQDWIDQNCVDYEFSFQSKHKRCNDTEIHIFHLFFDLTEST